MFSFSYSSTGKELWMRKIWDMLINQKEMCDRVLRECVMRFVFPSVFDIGR